MDAGQVVFYLKEKGIDARDNVRVKAGVVEFVGLSPEVEAQAVELMKSFKKPPEKYVKEREQAFLTELKLGDQLDAMYKFAISKGGVVPDPNAPADTPEGWCARVEAIKEKYPKT